MKPLIESFHIQSFRGLQKANLENMGRFNLLVGENNSGKTSVLEAIMLFLRPGDPRQWIRTLNVRDIGLAIGGAGEAISWLFPVVGRNAPDDRKEVVLEGITSGSNESLRLKYLGEKPMLPMASPKTKTEEDEEDEEDFVDEDREDHKVALVLAEWFSQADGAKSGTLLFSESNGKLTVPEMDNAISRIRSHPISFVKPHAHRLSRGALDAFKHTVLQQRKKLLIEVLQNFDPEITGVETVEAPGGSKVIIEHRLLGPMPLHSFGDGLRKAFIVVGHALRVPGGVLIIDEAETALHVKAQEDFFRSLLHLCKELNIQIVATTHSLDTVDAVIKAVPDHNDDLVGYHLSVRDGTREVKRYSGDLWQRLRFERGLDIR